jgi:alpha-galactosidase
MGDEKLLIEYALSEGEMQDVSPLRWEVERFIFELGITAKRGEPVEAYMIYYNYIQWKIKKGETNLLSKKGFFKEFRNYFHRYIDSGGRVYNVARDVFDLSDASKTKMKKMIKEERKWLKQSNRVKAGKKEARKRKVSDPTNGTESQT